LLSFSPAPAAEASGGMEIGVDGGVDVYGARIGLSFLTR
jgi:hypothetical protein